MSTLQSAHGQRPSPLSTPAQHDEQPPSSRPFNSSTPEGHSSPGFTPIGGHELGDAGRGGGGGGVTHEERWRTRTASSSGESEGGRMHAWDGKDDHAHGSRPGTASSSGASSSAAFPQSRPHQFQRSSSQPRQPHHQHHQQQPPVPALPLSSPPHQRFSPSGSNRPQTTPSSSSSTSHSNAAFGSPSSFSALSEGHDLASGTSQPALLGSTVQHHSQSSITTLRPHSIAPQASRQGEGSGSGVGFGQSSVEAALGYDSLLGPAPSSSSSSNSSGGHGLGPNAASPPQRAYPIPTPTLSALSISNANGSLPNSQLLSPLSPLVEPFSPSGGSGANWGVPPLSSFSKLPPPSTAPSSNLAETRQLPHQQQQPYPHLTQRQSSTQDVSVYSSMQQPHPPPSERKFSFGQGIPEHGLAQGQQPSHSAFSTPNLSNYGGASFGPSSDNAEYASSNYSATMSAQGSRDGGPLNTGPGGPAGLGLLPTSSTGQNPSRRELPTDRGGYVRAGYSADTISRAAAAANAQGPPPLSAGPSGGGAGSSGSAAVSSSASAAGLGQQPGDPVEEISTIFVVGFPEDMLEREFQNMFVFSTGFEAATLKVPASTAVARELAANPSSSGGVNNNVGGGTGNSSGGLATPLGTRPSQPTLIDAYGEPPGVFYEDAFGNLPLEGVVASTLNQVLGAGVRESAGSPATGTRKQIIGFAKFKTRQQALDARDVLSGKKVDAEKGCVLKAEMAKKNLHTKRGLSNELLGGPSFPLSSLDAATLGRLASTSNFNPAILAELARQTAVHQQQQAAAASGSQGQSPASGLPPSSSSEQQQQQQPQQRDARERERSQQSAAEAFYSVPSATSYGRERESSAGGSSSYARSTSSGVLLSSRDLYDDTPTPAAFYSLPRPARTYSRERATSPHDYQSEMASSPTLASSPQMRGPLLQSSAHVGNSMLQQLDEDPIQFTTLPPHPFDPQPLSPGGVGNDRAQGVSFHPGLYPTQQPPVVPSSSNQYRSLSSVPTSPSIGGPSLSNGIPRTQNPADMNAPKNTLYVGGLPAVLPSLTGPFSAAHLEDSLREAFSRCPGFRRISFRSKSNGPIVFVEFSDVYYATQALHEMYGNTLNGLVKGGIRLSYSKNPLGVRSGSVSNGTSGHTMGGMSPMGLNNPHDSPFNPFPSSNGGALAGRRPSESVYGPGDHRATMPRPQQQHSSSAFSSFGNSNHDVSSYPQHQMHPGSTSTFSPFS